MSVAELDYGTSQQSRCGLADKGTWRLEFGARPAPTGVQFKVWAPKAKELAVVLAARDKTSVPLTRIEADIFVGLLTQSRAGDDYFYLIDGGVRRPDPVSRWQPKGVHGASRVVDPDEFRWSDHHWKGIELKDYVLYELHVGTFTGTGTFEA